MNVKQAKEIIHQWALEEASQLPGFAGAFIAGSTNWLPDDVPLPSTSDVDVNIVLADANQKESYQKQVYQGVLIDVAYISSDQIQSPDTILSNYYLAYHFTSILNHVLLVAGLKNPTVHRVYAASRELLATYNRLPFHETLLRLLGSADLDRAQVEGHLAATIEVFDAAKEWVKTPFFGSTDISDDSRSVAIDVNQALIEHGYHREAMFGILVTHTWCQTALYNDAPASL